MDNEPQEVKPLNRTLEVKLRELELKVDYIKHNLIAKIFFAGSDILEERFDLMNEKCEIPEQDQAVLDAKIEATLDAYRDVVDLVWSDDFKEVDVCKDCLQESESKKIVEQVDKELKNNINPN
jgi:hypothetical protein